MRNRQRMAIGVVVTGICLVLAGCGGSSKVTQDEYDALQAELDAAEQELMDEQAAREAAETARQAAETARQAAETARQQAEADELAAETALEQAEEDTQAAETAQQTTAQELAQAQQQASSREANQRAERLKAAFGATVGARTVSGADASPVIVESIRSGSLTLTHGGYSTATLSGNGLRSTTMSLTSGGDSGKTVVYTDRELSRPLLDHFGAQRDSTDKTRFNLTLADADTATNLGLPAAIDHPQTSMKWRVTHGFSTSVGGTTADPAVPDTPDTKTAASYSGSLYGKSGSFVCGTVDGCQVQIAPAYANTAGDNGRFALESVAVTATDSGTLHFKPSGSPSLQLYGGGLVGADTEYMVFGYWREDPTSPAADYQVRAFAEVIIAPGGQAQTTVPTTFTATYDGTAVGMYVEQDPNDPVDTHRQGEFTADVYLEAAGRTTISGTIDDFQTTPTGGSVAPRTAERWVVRLMNAAASGRTETDGIIDGTTAYIDNLSGVKRGTWDSTFVPAHEHADTDLDMADAQKTPPAVTGTFDTRIENFVQLIGAYGAEVRQRQQ